VLIRVRQGRVVGREHRFLENLEGGGRPGRAERVPGALLRAGGGARPAGGGPVPAGGLGRPPGAAPRVGVDDPAAGHRPSAGWSWPTPTPGICWRVSGSSRSRPRSGPRTRCMRWGATWG
jgi:hypothetical protein